MNGTKHVHDVVYHLMYGDIIQIWLGIGQALTLTRTHTYTHTPSTTSTSGTLRTSNQGQLPSLEEDRGAFLL